ncbi:hypothetical protein PPACK8108_LOCUS15030 [Phakopsora pachyrhizi]|uniref:Uncharacterized protein n=1 Tax=Phakopsora pachyrhizi TaxID=170000 RepID=A0AAV0BAW1_PHAPC|nr:hypothetical protein PPACK8108_LOCUS15030 [Phakopsora pachyrhizi]
MPLLKTCKEDVGESNVVGVDTCEKEKVGLETAEEEGEGEEGDGDWEDEERKVLNKFGEGPKDRNYWLGTSDGIDIVVRGSSSLNQSSCCGIWKLVLRDDVEKVFNIDDF